MIRDILHRLEDRFPRPVLVWPVRVQGDGAAEEVAAAIRGFNALKPGGPVPRPDVLIVARGGGSIEDLWAFNEECVVRAAFESAIPLISAVGHETDTTLIDYVSDRRAPTPTGAAEMAVPVRADLIATVADLAARSVGAVGRRIERDRVDLRALGRALPSADVLLAAKRQRLDLAEARLAPALAAGASRHRARLQLLLDRMARRSPDVALANARARLARIDHRPLHALRNDVQRKGEALVQLGRRLVVARDASLERARALQARRADRLLALSDRLIQAGTRSVERRRDRLEGLAGLLGSLSYRAVLERGYVLVRDSAGLPVRHAADAGGGTEIEPAIRRRQRRGGPRRRSRCILGRQGRASGRPPDAVRLRSRCGAADIRQAGRAGAAGFAVRRLRPSAGSGGPDAVIVAVELRSEAEPAVERPRRRIAGDHLQAGRSRSFLARPPQQRRDRALGVAPAAQGFERDHRLDDQKLPIEHAEGDRRETVLRGGGREGARLDQVCNRVAEHLCGCGIGLVQRVAQGQPFGSGRRSDRHGRIRNRREAVEVAEERAGLVDHREVGSRQQRLHLRCDLRYPEDRPLPETAVDRVRGRDGRLGRPAAAQGIDGILPLRRAPGGAQKVTLDQQLARARPGIEAGFLDAPGELVVWGHGILRRR
ncbi:exonuclease VII large subunit [Methylobacterium sp. OAE515]